MFLSLLSFNFNIPIDRIIGAPGHGKCIANTINACDRRYLKKYICMVRIPEAEDSTKRI